MNVKAFLFAASLMLMAGQAVAIPFQISGSELDADFGWGGGNFTYTSYASSTFDLDEGNHYDFKFGTVAIPFAFGEGQASLQVSFATPTTHADVQDQGGFFILSILDIALGKLEWGQPVTFGYSYAGGWGGLFELNMFDVEGIKKGSSFDLWGRITNLASPSVPVPEPGSLLLLGTGLMGLGLVRRRRTYAGAD